jgi:aminopeptidase N
MKSFIFINLFFLSIVGYSQTTSDTIDVKHTIVNIEIPDIQNNQITAHATLLLKSKVNNLNQITFDLSDSLTTDSVLFNSTATVFNHTNHKLTVTFLNPLNQNDSIDLDVYYSGQLEQDPNGFGGNYFTPNYAYNVGVSLNITPHSYGRSWHPCLDNFIEKSSYQINLITADTLTSFCNGLKVFDSISNSKHYTSWELPQPISSYLAGFAVSDFTDLQWNYISPYFNDTTLVLIGARAIDTQNVKTSFQHLNDAIAIFESKYGKYQWDRVGYVMTPFPYGAMEHATNIVYPVSVTAGGSINYEDLMAHELSHHWWGDYITTESSKEMWINEGTAKYSEFIFFEGLYGYNAYFDAVKTNHLKVLYQHHIDDNGYYALANVPEAYTYGTTTYDKGADIMHNLRTYVGDSLFFIGLRGVLDSAKWSHLNSIDFKNYMSNTINVDLTDFFNGWIFQPGFPDFDIYSYNYTQNSGVFNLNLKIIQQLRGLSVFHQNVPLVLTIYDQNNVPHDYDIMVSDEFTDLTYQLNYEPAYFKLNRTQKLNFATTYDEKTITSNGQGLNDFIDCMTYSTNDSINITSEQHWVGAFGEHPSHIILSKDRYWVIKGDISNSKPIKFNVFFNARTTLPGGFLDNQLKDFVGPNFTEDSLVFLYRPTVNDPWVELPNNSIQKFNLGSDTDGYAGFLVNNITQDGHFTFGYKLYTAGLKETITNPNHLFEIFPNPANDTLHIKALNNSENVTYSFEILDVNGKTLINPILSNTVVTTLNIADLSSGVYVVKVIDLTNKENYKYKFIKK